MSVKKQTVFTRIKQQYKLAIGLVIISVSLTSIATLYVLYQQKEFAQLLNLTGRQRMLSQKINLQAYQLANLNSDQLTTQSPDIIKTLDEFKVGFQLLTQNSAINTLSEERQLQVNDLYFSNAYSIAQVIDIYSLEVKNFVTTGGNPDNQKYQVLFNHQELDNLLNSLEKIVSIYQQQAEQSVKNVETSILILWLLTLLIIGLEIVYIFRPTQKQIVRLFSQQEIAAKQLAVAKEQAEHADSIKSQLLANISHEVRTPLNGVLGMLNIMKTQRRFEPDYIQKAEHSALDLLAILDFILEFADLEQSRTKIQIKPFSFTQLLSNRLDIWSDRSENKGIEFDIVIGSNVPTRFESDEKAIESILNNLCSNAIKFTEFGSIKLDIQLLEPVSSKTYLQFKVHDSGIGMPKDTLDSIFEAFNQQSKGLNRKYAGCGIGLSIVKKLLHLLNGQILIESSIGKGTCVTVTIPIRLSAPYVAEQIQSEHKTLQGLTLLSKNPVLLHHYNKIASHLDINIQCPNDFSALEQQSFFGTVLFDLALLRDFPQLNPKQSWILLNTKKHQQDKSENTLPAFLSVQQLWHLMLGQVALEDKQSWPDKRALVVEDNEINQEVIRNLLEYADLEVELAKDGLQALELIKQQYFDIILMDLQMPNLDGLAATKQIRKMELDFQPPIVALTAHALRTDEQACYEAGMDDFLTKPVNADNLFNVLRRFLTS
ncbi:response regulator [Catenovulum sp. 2E275]|uniref:response regulator n=1 Tax=Catenovulum sp. 2E275 TaxID=2980497 RepID=UPI0021D101EC|nr:response regulator [Catenovulum sp. 2E275]MCU4677214.1 response regulator [Catenovulum sp. 2E275]